MPTALLPALPVTFAALAGYLMACGGSDRFAFHDFRGEPDPLRARDFAEQVRERYRRNLDEALAVRQRGHEVTITLLDEVAAV